MVWFTFSFLLAIPESNQEKVTANLNGKKENLQVEKNYTEIEVAKPNFSCHIEYVLFPNEEPKFIDIVCWDQAAKIYFEGSASAIIPLVTEKLRWIHMRVNHKMKLTSQDIPVFHSHNIRFTVTLGNKKFGESAKSDKPKKFYGPKFSDPSNYGLIKKQLFQPLSETEDDLQTVSFLKEHLTPQQQLYISLDTTLETSENFKQLYKALVNFSNEYNDRDFTRVPTPRFQELPPLKNILLQKINNEEAVNMGKENSKKTDVKNKEPEKMEFSIRGEEFLSGKKTFENFLKYNSEELPYIFCLGGAKDLLSKRQAQLYNPLTITLSHLNYMPVDQLENDGITKLKLRFLICNEFLAETNLIPIKKHMNVNCTRTVLTHSIDKHRLLYFIQTGGLKIDVLGNYPESKQGNERNIHVQPFPGGRPNHFMTSNHSNYNNTEFVLLGTATMDISPLILQPRILVLKENFGILGDTKFFYREKGDKFTNTNELNSFSRKNILGLKHYSKISTPVLTVVAGLGYPITSIYQTITINSRLFKRLLAVFYNANLAAPIIQIIQNEVSEFLGVVNYIKNGTNARWPLTAYHVGKLPDFESFENNKMTGFIVDCVDKILIYVESSLFGGVHTVWSYASSLHPTQGRILYDSELIYLDRLYENFFKFGGFIAINLKEAPEKILSKPESYMKKNIPEPAWAALKCIHLLIDCKSIKTATQSKLFPDFNSLCSLAIEFGVPIRFCENEGRN